MDRIISSCDRIRRFAVSVKEANSEVHEQAYWGAAGGGSVTPGRNGTRDGQVVPNVALSGPLTALRGRLRQASAVLFRVKPILDEAEGILKTGVVKALDPDMRKRLEDADRTARDYDRRHAHKA